MNTDPASGARASPEANAGYARIFRIIGSALEKLEVESFDLEIKDEGYYIRGYGKTVTEKPALARQRPIDLIGAWRKMRSRFFPQPSGAPFELRYTQESLRELDLQGRAQRGNSSGYPDAQCLTEALRSVGGFVDSKQASLSRLSMRGRWITLHYKSPEGHLVVEEHTAASLHNFCVRMRARRANEVQISPPPESVNIVAWTQKRRD